VTNVHNEDGVGYAPSVCLFHSRGSTNCCVWRTWACARNNESQIHRSAVAPSPAGVSDIKAAAGIDIANTVTTEITAGPPPIVHDAEGASPKARKLLGWFRRASIDEPRRMSGAEEEDVGLNNDAAPRANHSVETSNTAITVQYDVRRTVEDVRGESSSQEEECIDITDPRHEV
jgi:hypothetical protein